MIGFFEPLGLSAAVALSDIKSIGVERDNAHGVALRTVYLRNPDRQVETFTHEWNSLLARPVQIIPALAGTSTLAWDVSEEPPMVWRTPVIAWALCLDGEVRPVTPAGVNDAVHGPHYVELPCGKVEGVGEHQDPSGFDTAELLLAHFVERRAARAAASNGER